MELKNVKDDFIAYLGASGFKKSRIFMNLEGWKMLWNYLGYPNTLTLWIKLNIIVNINIQEKGVIVKTVTMRVDDSIYNMIKLAAEGQKRNLSNFIEFATMQYLTSSQFMDNNEMQEILEDKELVQNLMNGLDDLKNGDYTIV